MNGREKVSDILSKDFFLDYIYLCASNNKETNKPMTIEQKTCL